MIEWSGIVDSPEPDHLTVCVINGTVFDVKRCFETETLHIIPHKLYDSVKEFTAAIKKREKIFSLCKKRK
jgi:hypothetical protein